MSLGAVLIRPQPLLLPDSPVTPADVIVAFAESLLKDPAASLPALRIMGEETVKAFEDFLSGLVEKMRLSDGKFRALFGPFIDPFNAIVNGLGEDIVGTLTGVLEGAAKLLDQLTTDQVVEFFRKLLDIVEKDLGISPATLRDLFTVLTSRMIERLQARVIAGDNSDEAVALYDFGAGIDDIQRLVDREIQAPQFDSALLLGAIRDFWARLGLDRIVGVIHQILALGEPALIPLATIAQAIADANVSAGVGPAHPVASNGTTVTVEEPGPGNPNDPIAWYASWVAGAYHRFSADPAQGENTYQNFYLNRFTYLHVSREKMEQIAYHTTWIFDLVEAVLFHGLSIEKGDILNNLDAMVLDGVEAGLILAKTKRPLPWWTQWFIWPGASLILRQFESWSHAFSDNFGLFMLLADVMENICYRRWTWLMRETLLSTLTLLNHDPNAPKGILPGPRNVDMVDGVCHAFMETGVLLMPFILSKANRGNYGLGTGLVGGQIGIALLCSIPSAMFWGFIGYLLGRASLAGERVADSLDGGHMLRILFKERMFGKYRFSSTGEGFSAVGRGLLAFITYPVDHLVYLYMFTNDSTGDGKLAIDTNGNSAGQIFQGYPDSSNSPYLLPYAATSRMCVQNNMGIWSHYPQGGSGQVYAYDFAMDQGEEVICSRSGIVVNLRDTIPNGPGQNWNFVEIMHLVAIPPGATPPPGVTPLAAIAPPPTLTTFADNSTNLPPGILFPPYWDGAGNNIFPFSPPLHPSAAILPAGWTPPAAAAAYYGGFPGFPAGTQFAFLIPAYDRGLGSGAGFVLNNGVAGGTLPLLATFMVYGHGLNNFMTQAGVAGAPAPGTSIYRSSNVNQVIGQFVQQGQVIMLADNTGVSFFNHVHVQVSGQISASPGTGTGSNWSIPYIYADVVHNAANGLYKALYSNGRPRAFTTYSSGNTRVPPK